MDAKALENRSRAGITRDALRAIRDAWDQPPYRGPTMRALYDLFKTSTRRQFYLRLMQANGLVEPDTTKRMWTITPKGREILDLLNALERDLGYL